VEDGADYADDAAANDDTDDYWGGMSDGRVVETGDDSLADGVDGIANDFFVSNFPMTDDDVEVNGVDDEYDGEGGVDDGLVGGRHREHEVDAEEDETDDYLDGGGGDDDFFDESPSVDNFVDDTYFADAFSLAEEEDPPAWGDVGIGRIAGRERVGGI
jgi:hypothetical protein